MTELPWVAPQPRKGTPCPASRNQKGFPTGTVSSLSKSWQGEAVLLGRPGRKPRREKGHSAARAQGRRMARGVEGRSHAEGPETLPPRLRSEFTMRVVENC